MASVLRSPTPRGHVLRLASRAALSSQTPATTRSFLNWPESSPQTLIATRRLPHPPSKLYDLISDIDGYRHFLPYCKISRVTAWTDPDPTGRRWPTRADLTADWAGISESYSSRVFCIPDSSDGGIVEAISGDAYTEISAADLARHGLQDPGPGAGDGEGTFQSLVTRWTVRPLAADGATPCSEVDLSIKFRFANPLFAAVSSAVADKVAPVMVDAFVREARRALDDNPPSRRR